MKKISTTLVLFFCGLLIANAQDEATQKPTPPTAGQIFSAHHSRTYQAAMRYNDMVVAKQALYDLLVENPQNDSILYSLSLLYIRSNQYASAVLTAEDIKAARPDHTGALEIAALGYENLGLKDKALDNYETLYLKTESFETLYKMAFLQYDLKKYAESKTNADILLSKKEAKELTVSFTIEENKQKDYPIKVSILNLKGLIAKEEGDKNSARKFFNEALAIAPDFTTLKNNLADLDK